MTVTLPPPIANYFDADRRGGAAVADCFAADAVVVDERRTHRGIAAIRAWKEEASGKYQYTSEPVSVAERDGKIVVTAHVSGNFPGSPVDLRYFFRLAGDRIAELEIVS